MIYDKADMEFLENPFRSDIIEICFHEFKEKIYVHFIFRGNCFVQFDDIGV